MVEIPRGEDDPLRSARIRIDVMLEITLLFVESTFALEPALHRRDTSSMRALIRAHSVQVRESYMCTDSTYRIILWCMRVAKINEQTAAMFRNYRYIYMLTGEYTYSNIVR